MKVLHLGRLHLGVSRQLRFSFYHGIQADWWFKIGPLDIVWERH